MDDQNAQKVILLIEDEADLVDVYTEYLNSAGYQVVTAYNGEDGLRMAREDHWDLMLLDIMLPEKDGMAVLEVISSEEGLKRGSIAPSVLIAAARERVLDPDNQNASTMLRDLEAASE